MAFYLFLEVPAQLRHLFILYFKNMSSRKIKSEPLKTILVITLGMTIVYLVTNLKWTLQIALIVGLSGVVSNYLAVKIDFLWMKLTWVLSMIVPNILLTAFFFIVLMPVALLSRIFGKKNQLSLKNTTDSLFKDHKRTFDRSYFEKPW